MTQLMKHLPMGVPIKGHIKKANSKTPQQEPRFPKRVIPKRVGGDQAAAAGVEGVAGRY